MGTHPIFESDFDCLTEKMALKILVDQGYELSQPHPPTLFCLLEFDGVRLATSHNEVRNGKVKFNEEAEFQIKKSGNLRIQLCSVDGKKSVLSLNEHKLYGRAKFLVDYNDQNQQKTIEALQLKSKSGKDRAKIKFKLTIPANPNYDGQSNLLAQQALSTNSLNRSSNSLMSPALTPKKVGDNPFGSARNGSMRSEHSSQDYGSRRSLDSAGFDSHQNNPFEDSTKNDSDSVGNPFGSNNNLAARDQNPFEEEPEVEKKREKKSSKSSNKFARNSLIGSLGLGSHKEDSGAAEEELARLRQENEWYNRQNKILQEDVQSKDKEIKDLNLYIESLLVKIMTKAPEVLQS